MSTWLRNHVSKDPPPHLCHSPPFPHILPCSLPVLPLLPPLLFLSALGASCCQWPYFHGTGLVVGVPGLPSPCSLKPYPVPGLLGAQGRTHLMQPRDQPFLLPLPCLTSLPRPSCARHAWLLGGA